MNFITEDKIIDLYDLIAGTKKSLLLNHTVDINEVYHEAYEEGCWINVSRNEHHGTNVVTISKQVTAKIVAEQLIGALAHGENQHVVYKGEFKLPSIRNASYRHARQLGISVSIKSYLGMIYVSVKESSNKLHEMLDGINVGDVKMIPTSLYTSVVKLRSAIQAYSEKNGVKFRTKVRGKNLEVSRLDKSDLSILSSVIRLKNFIKGLPWGLPVPIDFSEYPDLTESKIKYHVYKESDNTVSFNKGVVTKQRYRLARKEGYYVVVINGDEIHKTPISTFNDTDVAIIDRVIEPYGITYNDLNKG